jgi:hypothetical protein
MHFEDETSRFNYINKRVFYFFFIQLGVMITLATWNAREYGSHRVNRVFGGIYTDFNKDWFDDVGILI